MQVVIDAQLLSTAQSYRGAGVSNYSRHLLAHLGDCAPVGTRASLTAFISDPHFRAANIRLQHTPPILQNPLARIAWEQMVLPLHLRRMGADGVHGLVNVLPLSGRTPAVVTVHDLSFLHLPEKLPAARRWYLSQLCRASVDKAQRVIAVSRQTADDLMHFFGVQAGKISVIHNGVAAQFQPGDLIAVAEFRRQRGLPERFLLYLGTLEPRKNLELLVRAYASWLAEAKGADREIRLVLAGGQGWYYKTIFQQVAALGLADRVLFPGFIPENELPNWYRAAELFVYPSLFEGFGLPVLEAMACGTPVLCSQASSLMEITGESALTFSSQSEAGLVAGLREFYCDRDLPAELRIRGLTQAAKFTWQRTATATYQIYHTTFG